MSLDEPDAPAERGGAAANHGGAAVARLASGAPQRFAAVPARAVGADVRRTNLGVILRQLGTLGGMDGASRASVAAATGLTRATVSRLVADLIDAGLVREGARATDGRAGRPGTALELDGEHVLAVGAEINVDYLATVVLDLAGREVDRREVSFDARAAGADATVTELAGLCTSALDRAGHTRHGRPVELAGLGVAVPALVAVAEGVVTEAPNLHWRDVALADKLCARLDLPVVRVGNDANLSAVAEHRMGEWAGVPDLIYITGEVGIGGGIVAGGRPLLGRHGHGGEVGHMRVDRAGRLCGCGRRGCWEAAIGLDAVLGAAGLPGSDHGGPREQVGALVDRASEGDALVAEVLTELGTSVGVGAANLSNLFDPQVIVLGGYFIQLAEWILPPARDALSAGVLAPAGDLPALVTSRLGFTAAAQGAALDVLESVFENPVALTGG